ncbi:MAG: trigger factor [Lactobacillus sp.]|jgi:trigger factor|uniref:Trigger factor n=1 Tax=Lacticaseibacillus suilingensis TaxID=2799577 RepID=A0ABW4BFJ1_9LACO|nr:trigger factor [Lacticaseibacillus suilingensis]MCI1893402.1 trigger factor [Lactobacillus sp.]MCI1918450.1 trigger factor [Lactobacillus sp.]MCI1940586.1 trigger factor [Lactobacillus sp.]MCI1971009.1 trigger factor [Lactobacillus sp.]MCI2016255.1 trigger factor [Lactobacillus sp.]
MAANWEKKGDTDGVLTFEIAQDKIKEGLDKAFNRVKKNLNIPGFRKGHVSRTVFDRMYGEAALYEDALNIVLPDAYDAAIAEAGINAVDQPKIDIDSMDEGKPWVIKATVTVAPEVTLGDYKGITVDKQDRTISDADVDAELTKKQESQAELVLKEDGAAEKGDTLTIDYVGTVDGKEFDGGSAKNYALELGSNSFIPGFEDQLIGAKAGDEVTVKVTFPEDYQAKDLAGKDAEFKTTVHEIKSKELPALDDDFAKDLDDEDVETLEELKLKIKSDLQAKKDEEADDAIQEQAIAKVVDNATIPAIPQAMIDTEVDNQMNQYLGSMQQQGIDPKMYYQLTGTSEADLKKQFASNAESRVKTNLVLEAVVKAEKIEPTEDQVKGEIKRLAGEYNMEEKAVRRALTDDMLKHDIGVQDAITVITDSVKESAPKAADKADADKEDADK